MQQIENLVNNWTIISDLGNSYFTYRIPEKEIEDFQVKMIQKNSISSILKVHMLNNEQEYTLYYNISGQLNLLEYIHLHGIGYDLLIVLMKGILSVLNEAKDYLLYENGLLLQGDKIFINPDSGNVKFVYLPSKKALWDNRCQLQYLIQTIIPYIHKQDEKAISLIHQLRMLLEDSQCNVTALQSILDCNQPKDLIKHFSYNIENKEQNSQIRDLNIAPTKLKRFGNDAVMTFIILQGFIAIILLLCASQWLGAADEHGYRLIKIISLIGMLGISEVIIFFKVLFHKGLGENIPSDKLTLKTNKVKAILTNDQKVEEKRTSKMKTKTKKNDNSKRIKWNWDNELQQGTDENKDNSPSDLEVKRAYIVDSQDIYIPILKTPFIIGNMKSIVDFSIQNDMISRVHCQIINENERYYLVDLESKNGTYLNQRQLEGHTKCLLNDNDEIRIINEHYTFKYF